jgi:DNA-binding Lrp family transcriptional regulator
MSLALRHRTLPRLEVSGGRQGARYPQRLRRRGSEARQVDPALTGGHRRSRRRAALEASGVIQSYHAHLSAEAIGLGVLVFVQVTLATHSPDNAKRFQKLIAGLPEVQEAYSLTGDADYFIKLIVADLKALSRILNEVFLPHESVAHLRSSIVLDRLKQTTHLPLQHLQGGQ